MAVALVLLAVVAQGCNYNAAVVVNLPRWRADDRSVVFLGLRPQGSCDGDPGQLTFAFLLRDDRETGIEEGGRLRVADDTIIVSTTGEAPTVPASAVAVRLQDPEATDGGVGGLGPLSATVTALRYVPLTSGGRSDRRDPVTVALLMDNGYDVQVDDGSGARFDGAAELVTGLLCQGAERCPFGEAELGLYELAEGVVNPVAAFTGDGEALRDLLDEVRDPARARGDGPIYDGLVQAAGEVTGQVAASGPGAGGALVLVTRDGRSESRETLESALTAVAERPVLIAARSTTPELRRIACESGGVLATVPSPEEFAPRVTALRDALRGRFEADVTVEGLSGLAPGDHRLDLELEVSIGGLAASTTMPIVVSKVEEAP